MPVYATHESVTDLYFQCNGGPVSPSASGPQLRVYGSAVQSIQLFIAVLKYGSSICEL